MNLFLSLPEDLQRFILLFLTIEDYDKLSCKIIDNPSDLFWRLKFSTLMPEMLTVNFKTLCERNHYQNLLDNFDFKNESIEKFLNDDRFLQNYVNIGMSESKRNLLGLLCLMNTDNSKYIQTLLSKANPELLKSSILRATYEAIKTQNIETLKLLLDYTMSLFGTYKNFESSNESLLLFHAIFYNYLEKLKLLVDYGADIHATWYGDTMLEVARRHGRTEILTYLEKLY